MISGQNCPLKSVTVSGVFYDAVGHCDITQRFENTGAPIETYYTLALDPNHCVTQFSMQIGKRDLVGILNEKSHGKQMYDEAKEKGERASVFVKEGPGLYKIALTIGAGETIQIKFKLAVKLSATNKGYRFVFPTTIAPVYDSGETSAEARALAAVPHASSVHVPYDFDIKIDWYSSDKIREIVASSYDQKGITDEKTFDEGCMVEQHLYKGTISSIVRPEDGDFVVQLNLVTISPTLYCNFNHADSCYYGMFICRIPVGVGVGDHNLEAQAQAQAQAQVQAQVQVQEYVFLLDRSNSMHGERIKHAKKALIFFLNSIPANSWFNIVSFGSKTEYMWKASKTLTDESKECAIDNIKQFRADMGGTELFGCLENLGNKCADVDERIVILLTDGDVNNGARIKNMLEEKMMENDGRDYGRVFGVGIGKSVKRVLMNQVCDTTRGTSVILMDASSMSNAVVEIIEKASHSYISNIKFGFGRECECDRDLACMSAELMKNVLYEPQGNEASQNALMDKLNTIVKTIMPNVLYPGDYFTLPLKFDAAELGRFITDSFVISGLKQGVPYENVLQAKVKIVSNDAIKSLWGDYIIKYASDMGLLNSCKKAILQLSLDYHILSTVTSFVCVDSGNVMANSDDMTSVYVPHYASSSDGAESRTYTEDYESLTIPEPKRTLTQNISRIFSYAAYGFEELFKRKSCFHDSV